jgi:hypothetical protein
MTTRRPNDRLRDLVAESGLTYEALARSVRAVAGECGVALQTNKSAVEHWIAGAVPRGNTGRYLAAALSRRLGRLLTPVDLGLPDTGEATDDTTGLSLGADPLDVLLPMWRYEVDRRSFLTASAYSVAAAALPLAHVQEIADRTAAARTGHIVGMAEVAAASRPSDTYARIVALDLVASAEMQLKRGSIDQACATWHRALDHMDGIRSVRTHKAITRMRADIARFRARGLRGAAELDHRARDVLAST